MGTPRLLTITAALAVVLAATAVAGGAAPSAAGAGAVAPARHDPPTPPGYWLAASDGGIFSFGVARFAGSTGGLRLAAPIVGLAATPTGRGYWLAAADGGVFTFGDAVFAGSAGGLRLAAPIVGIAATPTGLGYWLAAADGGVFAFGDATYFGSAPGPKAHGPVVAFSAAPSGRGYRLVTSDGQVLAFGDAAWSGDAATLHLARPVVTMATTPSGLGYWLVASDGGVFTFGDARFAGSSGGLPLVAPIVGATPTASGEGYWLVASDGGVFAYGDAAFAGSTGALHLARPVVAAAAVPAPHGVATAVFYYPWYGSQSVDGAWRHWDEGGHTPPGDIGSDYYPLRGAYSSNDAAVVGAQMAEIADAGIGEVVTSWWGQGSFEDQALGGVIAAAARHGVRVGIHLEPYPGRSGSSVASDVSYLRGRGITDIWVYEALLLPGDALRAVNDQYPGDPHLAETGDLGAVRSGAFARWAAAAHFSAIYTYDPLRLEAADLVAFCATARAVGLGCAPAAAPGFTAVRATGSTAVRSREDGATYDERWMGAIGARPDIVAITSYNEWHEGSQIEPAQPQCIDPAVFCYLNYDGAYGLTGPPATAAYVGRTKVWIERYRAASP
jgi:hypothetical protein